MVAHILGGDPNSTDGFPLAVTIADKESAVLCTNGGAHAPYPDDGAAGVSQNVVLRSAAGVQAVTQNVSFGSDKAAVTAATPASTGIYKGSQRRIRVPSVRGLWSGAHLLLARR